MKKSFLTVVTFLSASALFFACNDAPACKSGRHIVLADQSKYSVTIVDADSGETVWTWDRFKSGLPEEHQAWFSFPTEVKPVYNGKCILIVSNDGIGLIRIADHRMIWYAESGGGFPHSAEVLPDGNIAVACSHSNTDAGDKLKIYVVDYDSFPATAPAAVYPLPAGHNAVWDRKNNVLWATAYTQINCYSYDVNDGVPAFTLVDSVPLPDGDIDPHDMFPVYGERKLWLTTPTSFYKFDPDSRTFETLALPEGMSHLKSVSSGPEGFPTIVLKPTEEWWSNEIRGIDGTLVYEGASHYKIYKGRWMVDNTFSYPKRHSLPKKLR